MLLKKIGIGFFFASMVPLFFFIAVALGQHTWHVSLWPLFAKGFMLGILITGIPFGVLLGWDYFKPKPNRNNRSYSA